MEASFVIDEEVFKDVQKAEHLVTVESENDPEDDPYKSQYEARELLISAKKAASVTLEGRPIKITLPQSYLYPAFLCYKLAINYTETGEAHDGEKEIAEALDRLESLPSNEHSELLLMAIINQKGCVFCARGNHESAKIHLNSALDLYAKYKTMFDKPGAALDEYLSKPVENETEELAKKRWEAFEDQHTFTLFYLAQVYTKLGEGEKASEYCLQTLQRQLDANKYTPKDWAMNAATLSQYYITQNEYRLARHCLCAAATILDEAKANHSDEEERALLEDKILKAWADLQRCWGKYCIALLEASKTRLINEMESEVESSSESSEKSNDYRPSLFNLDVTEKEKEVCCDWLLDFEMAREVFKNGKSWLEKSKEYYKMDGFCTDFIEISQDLSALYMHLAFFEPDPQRQCQMHKRRVDMLLTIHDELSHQHYLQYRRSLQFEAGEIFSGMMDIKIAIIEEKIASLSEHTSKKINQLASNAIKQYEGFIESFRTPSNQMPEQFEIDDQRPVLLAHFYLGRLYSKLIEPDTRKRLANLESSLDHYRFIVNYVEKYPEARSMVINEISVCEEMVQLMHVKMEKIRQDADVYK